LTKSMKGD